MPSQKELAKYLFFVTAIAVAALMLWPYDRHAKTLPNSRPISGSSTNKLEQGSGFQRHVIRTDFHDAKQHFIEEPQSPSPQYINRQPDDGALRLMPNGSQQQNIASNNAPTIVREIPTTAQHSSHDVRLELADQSVRIQNPHVQTSIKPLPKIEDPVAAFVAASVAERDTPRVDSEKANVIGQDFEPRALAKSQTSAESMQSSSQSSRPFRSFDALDNKDWRPDSNSTHTNIGTADNSTEFAATIDAHEALSGHSPIVPTSGFSFDPPVAQSSGPSQSPQGTTSYRLADQPKLGDHYKAETPLIDCNAHQIETLMDDFSPDPVIADYPYDPYLNQDIYQCKQLNANQRPLLELGRPWYQLGQLSPGSSILGFHNNVNPQFLIFGDYRQAFASNRSNGDSTSQLAFELNTIWNLFITSTERVVWGTAPFDNGAANTHYDFERDSFEVETDFDIDFGYFEGDLGAIVGGFVGKTLPFDAPFAVGLTPILIQNGIWLNDAVEGMFFTVPARNSARLGISNMDISFGFVWDEINSNAFADDKNAAKAYLVYTFIEALNGYFEIDYAFLEDRSLANRSYHNISMAYSRRFGNFISHSTRVIANAGQEVSSGPQTADGVLLLFENSLITSNPYTVVPYFNMFAGFDTPQSVAGNQQLIATGILFESDGMTDYPTLDTRGSNTFGGAMGLNLLAQDFSQQLIMEVAAVFRGSDSDLDGDQYGIGVRHQVPLNNSWILRSDAMYGFLRGTDDSTGARIELRKKF